MIPVNYYIFIQPTWDTGTTLEVEIEDNDGALVLDNDGIQIIDNFVP